jgi:hypothetical protein
VYKENQKQTKPVAESIMIAELIELNNKKRLPPLDQKLFAATIVIPKRTRAGQMIPTTNNRHRKFGYKL